MEKIDANTFKKTFPSISHYMSPDELEGLLNAMKLIQVPAGEMILQDDHQNDSLYLLVQGELSSYILHDGEKIKLGPIYPGQSVGEVSMLDAEPASATVIAESDATLLALSRESFFDLDKRFPNVTSNILHTISKLMASRIRIGEEMLFRRFSPEQTDEESKTEIGPIEWAKRIYQKLHGHEEVH
jgi:CRP-like cAMP-binding protein